MSVTSEVEYELDGDAKDILERFTNEINTKMAEGWTNLRIWVATDGSNARLFARGVPPETKVDGAQV